MTALITLVTTAAAAPLVRWLLMHHGVIDHPNHRSSHTTPTPRGGGLACVAGIVVATVVAVLRDLPVPGSVLAGALALALVGFVDDRRGLPAILRLGAQIAIGLIVGLLVAGPVGAALAMVAYPVVVNVVNFMDGINGITATTLGLWGAVTLLEGRNAGIDSLVLIGALTAGACLGFLPWNAPAARLFLGDVGSYLLGGLVAGGLLLAWHGGAQITVVAAPLCIYLLDAFVTIMGRARAGEPLMEAHRDHIYQRLTSAPSTRSHGLVAVFIATLAAIVSLAWAVAPPIVAVIVSLCVAALYLTSPRWLVPAGPTTPKSHHTPLRGA